MTEPQAMYRGTVYPWHCDHMGHMNVMWYVGKFDEATWNVFASVGMTIEFMRSHGSATAGVEQNIVYKKELTAGDVIAVYSKVLEVRDRVVRIQHEMRKPVTEEAVATMTLTAVHIDSSTRRATSFPAAVRSKLEALVR
jgi:acyl-CoA thioester hydrolase